MRRSSPGPRRCRRCHIPASRISSMAEQASGGVSRARRRKPRSCMRGSSASCRCGRLHSGICRAGPEVLTPYLRQAMVDRLAEEVFGRDPKHVELRPQLGVTDPLLEQLALALSRAMRDGERGADLYVDHLAQTMAVQVLRGHCSGIGAQAPATAMLVSKFTRVLDYIDAAMDGAP